MAKQHDAREHRKIGPRGEPIGAKGQPGGMTGEGHGTVPDNRDAKPGRGSWKPAQGSAGEGMPAQKRGRALQPTPPKAGGGSRPATTPRPRDDGM